MLPAHTLARCAQSVRAPPGGRASGKRIRLGTAHPSPPIRVSRSESVDPNRPIRVSELEPADPNPGSGPPRPGRPGRPGPASESAGPGAGGDGRGDGRESTAARIRSQQLPTAAGGGAAAAACAVGPGDPSQLIRVGGSESAGPSQSIRVSRFARGSDGCLPDRHSIRFLPGQHSVARLTARRHKPPATAVGGGLRTAVWRSQRLGWLRRGSRLWRREPAP